MTIPYSQLEQENATLRRCIRQAWWQARRYCDGRATYATSTYNDATRVLIGLGVLPRHNLEGTELQEGDDFHWPENTPWARDGMGPGLGKLTPEEHAEGEPLAAWQGRVDQEEVAYMGQIASMLEESASIAELLGEAGEYIGGLLAHARLDRNDRLCGSGLIEKIRVALRLGIPDRQGRLPRL